MKMTSEKKLAELTDFENVLDTFGGDPARWPTPRRERLLSLVASDAEAQRLLREARALDAVLTRTAGPPASGAATLADRIVAAAIAGADPATSVRPTADQKDAAAKAKPGVVIAWPRSDSSADKGKASINRAAAARAAAPSGPALRRDRSSWSAAAMLAASLVVGVFVGALDLVPTNVSRLVAGVETTTDAPRELVLLQGDDLLDFLDEGPL